MNRGAGAAMKGSAWRNLAVTLTALSAVWAGPAEAQIVLDGDTLRYKGVVVHLWGIDAPEKNQVCADGWPAGRIAADYLAGLINHRDLVCDLKDTKGSGPPFAVCKVDGRDLNAAMASDGMAWANPAQSADYAVADSNAMIAVLGVHAHPCMKAWDWRAQNPGGG